MAGHPVDGDHWRGPFDDYRGFWVSLANRYADHDCAGLLIDEILNAVLFLMISFEVFAVAFEFDLLVSGTLAIALALLGRLVAVAVPVMMLKPFRNFSAGVIPIMTWGGLKGDISVALTLFLPDGEWKPLILTATYVVVVFSIIVQGLTVTRLAERVGRAPELPDG